MLWVFQEEHHRSEVPFSSHPIKGTYYLHDSCMLMLTLSTCRRSVRQVSPLQCYSLFSPFPYCPCWKKVTMCCQHLKSENLCSPHLRVEYLHDLFGIPLHRRLVFSPSFINLLDLVFTSAWIHGYLFYTLGFNLIQLSFFALIAPALAMGSAFNWSLCIIVSHGYYNFLMTNEVEHLSIWLFDIFISFMRCLSYFLPILIVLFASLLLLFFLNYLFIYLFIFGCVGSLFLCEGFLQLR